MTEPGKTEASPQERPFGEDITTPQARALPATFHGQWGFINSSGRVMAEEHVEAEALTIEGRRLKVIAVRFISPEKLAVVAREGDAGNYALYYRGLDSNGALVDLENPTWVLTRLA